MVVAGFFLNGAKRLIGANIWNVWKCMANYIVPGITENFLRRAEAFGRVIPQHLSHDLIA